MGCDSAALLLQLQPTASGLLDVACARPPDAPCQGWITLRSLFVPVGCSRVFVTQYM
jgi:hypothetical protein